MRLIVAWLLCRHPLRCLGMVAEHGCGAVVMETWLRSKVVGDYSIGSPLVIDDLLLGAVDILTLSVLRPTQNSG